MRKLFYQLSIIAFNYEVSWLVGNHYSLQRLVLTTASMYDIKVDFSEGMEMKFPYVDSLVLVVQAFNSSDK